MSDLFLLDTNILSKIVYLKRNDDIYLWFKEKLDEDILFILPEISDYEVRRGLLHKDLKNAIIRLDGLKKNLTYLLIQFELYCSINLSFPFFFQKEKIIFFQGKMWIKVRISFF
jgi:hypothetical protein